MKSTHLWVALLFISGGAVIGTTGCKPKEKVQQIIKRIGLKAAIGNGSRLYIFLLLYP